MPEPQSPEPAEPFVFRLFEEKLRECRGMTAEEKLRWLEEPNAFVRKFVSPQRLARWARLCGRNQDHLDAGTASISSRP